MRKLIGWMVGVVVFVLGSANYDTHPRLWRISVWSHCRPLSKQSRLEFDRAIKQIRLMRKKYDRFGKIARNIPERFIADD